MSMDTEYDWEAAALCGDNQDPAIVRFARKCFDAGYAKAKAEQAAEEDPYQSEDYQRFVSEQVEHCHCSERFRPCDGVLASGICDGIEDEPERYENDPEGDEDY